jgi:hypothetical protein
MATVALQGIGNHKAVKACDLKIGDKTVWNYGEVNVISEIVKETAKTISFKFEDCGDYIRSFKKERLVAVTTL